MINSKKVTAGILLIFIFAGSVTAGRQMEKLGRGLVAMNLGEGKVYVGWRLLGTDAENIKFDRYRQTADDKPLKLNKEPIAESTNFVDTTADVNKPNSYFVIPLADGEKMPAGSP